MTLQARRPAACHRPRVSLTNERADAKTRLTEEEEAIGLCRLIILRVASPALKPVALSSGYGLNGQEKIQEKVSYKKRCKKKKRGRGSNCDSPVPFSCSSMKSRGFGWRLFVVVVSVVQVTGPGVGCSDSQDCICLLLASSIPIPTNAFAPDSRQEPYEVILHVRICAGGGWQQPYLPR